MRFLFQIQSLHTNKKACHQNTDLKCQIPLGKDHLSQEILVTSQKDQQLTIAIRKSQHQLMSQKRIMNKRVHQLELHMDQKLTILMRKSQLHIIHQLMIQKRITSKGAQNHQVKPIMDHNLTILMRKTQNHTNQPMMKNHTGQLSLMTSIQQEHMSLMSKNLHTHVPQHNLLSAKILIVTQSQLSVHHVQSIHPRSIQRLLIPTNHNQIHTGQSQNQIHTSQSH